MSCWRSTLRARRKRTNSERDRADDRQGQREPGRRSRARRSAPGAASRPSGFSTVESSNGPGSKAIAAPVASDRGGGEPGERPPARRRQAPVGEQQQPEGGDRADARHPHPGRRASARAPARSRSPSVCGDRQPADRVRRAGRAAGSTRSGCGAAGWRPARPPSRTRRRRTCSASAEPSPSSAAAPVTTTPTNGADDREPQPPGDPAGHRSLLSHSETWAGWTVSATTPRRSAAERLEVELVAQPPAERLERPRRVVAAAVEAPVHDRLDARPRRAEQRRHRERRGRDREAGLADREPDQQHEPEVRAAERRGQRAVDQRAPDHQVDVVEPVAQDRDAGRHRQRGEGEQADQEGGVGDDPGRGRRRARAPTPATADV